MTNIHMDQYLKLTDADVQPQIVGLRLSDLVRTMPLKFRPQVDRCYLYGFRETFCGITLLEGAKNRRVRYFTEDFMHPEFHALAYPIFNIVVAYAGTLADVIRNRPDKSVCPQIIAAAHTVFCYSREGELPAQDRADLVEFAMAPK